jgi:hypothetical protein
LDGRRVDSVGVETSSDCAGNGMVSFYSVYFGEVDAYMHRGNHFDVRELPNMEFMHILHSINLRRQYPYGEGGFWGGPAGYPP